ncbi:MAG: DJ-1/PfpI family protein [Leptospiraceae bacterium]|nr:DJ-1/PfpI family protein [Leptospiraceae bacterium]
MPKVLTILAEGFEEIEAVTIIDVLRRAGVDVVAAGMDSIRVTGSHAIQLQTDCTLADAIQEQDSFDMLVLPGGLPGAHNLRDNAAVIELVQYFHRCAKITAAICAAPVVLAKAGVLEGRQATSYPGHLEGLKDPAIRILPAAVVTDDTVVTSRGPATAIAFSLELVALLEGQDAAQDLAAKMLVLK